MACLCQCIYNEIYDSCYYMISIVIVDCQQQGYALEGKYYVTFLDVTYYKQELNWLQSGFGDWGAAHSRTVIYF